jgi:hypothetical protein
LQFKELIIKDSWPLADRATEGGMFFDLDGSFGLPDIATHYTVKGPDREQDDTALILPEDAAPMSLFENVSKSNTINTVDTLNTADTIDPAESRIHKRIVFKTVGKPLSAAAGPRQLVLGILHAMLGMPQLL